MQYTVRHKAGDALLLWSLTVNATAMSRAFSKWWDKRKIVGGNRAEADIGWKAGVQWALEQAAIRCEEGLSNRADRVGEDEERRQCADEIRELSKAFPR